MSRPSRRPTTTAVLLGTCVAVLTGCSAVGDLVGGGGAVRDDTTGEIVEAAEADAFEIRVGDCLDLGEEPATEEVTEEVTEVSSVATVPCGDPHDSEVYAAHQLDGDDFPGDQAVSESADELCYDGFADFVGLEYEDSELDFTTFFPTQDGWERLRDREVLCVAIDPDGGVTGSLAGVGY